MTVDNRLLFDWRHRTELGPSIRTFCETKELHAPTSYLNVACFFRGSLLSLSIEFLDNFPYFKFQSCSDGGGSAMAVSHVRSILLTR